MYMCLGINLFAWESGAMFFLQIVSKLQGHIIYFLYLTGQVIFIL